MNGFDVALSRLVNSPDLLGVMLWAALFGLGASVLVSGVVQGAARPRLAERLARQTWTLGWNRRRERVWAAI
jgi:hypothetical protein